MIFTIAGGTVDGVLSLLQSTQENGSFNEEERKREWV